MLVNSRTDNFYIPFRLFALILLLLPLSFCNTLPGQLSLCRARGVGKRLERKRSRRRWGKERDEVGAEGGGQQFRLSEDNRQCES